MANDASANLPAGSPVESRAEAYRRLRKLRHRLFWVHPIGFIVAIAAAGGDMRKLKHYVAIAIAFSIAVQVVWVLQAMSTRRSYGAGGVHER